MYDRADLGLVTAPCFGILASPCLYAMGGADATGFNTMEIYRPG